MRVPSAEHKEVSLRRLMYAVQRLALDAQAQVRQYPAFVVVADELALEFGYWLEVCEDHGYLEDRNLADELARIERHLEDMSMGEPQDRWTLEALAGAPEWRDARTMARRALATAGWPRETPPTPEDEGDGFVPESS